MKQYSSIGEIARQARVRPTTLRYYEAIGLLPAPVRAPNGYRRYPASTLDVLRFIRAGKAAGFTLTELRKVLAARRAGRKPCAQIQAMLERKVADLECAIEDLLALRRRLDSLRAAFRSDVSDSGSSAVCPYLEAGEA
ncbi:MAG: MerR family transcriptional regulator [Candidatus Methylomirabilales bacterium]